MQTGDLLQTELQLCTVVRPTVRPVVTYSDFFMARGRQTYNHVVWNFLMTSCTRSNRTIRPTRDDKKKFCNLAIKKLTYYITHMLSFLDIFSCNINACPADFPLNIFIHSFVNTGTFMTRHNRRPAGRHLKHVNTTSNDATVFRLKQTHQLVQISLIFQPCSTTSTKNNFTYRQIFPFDINTSWRHSVGGV